VGIMTNVSTQVCTDGYLSTRNRVVWLQTAMQEVSRVTQVTASDTAALDTAALDAPVSRTHGMPVIDPGSLSRAQRDGRRCAVPNCRRRLADLAYQIGRLPAGQPVLVCEDCAPPFSPALSRGPG
jgi:hypothetical protein